MRYRWVLYLIQTPLRSMQLQSSYIWLMTREVPWNFMELLMPSKLAHSKFHGIPWNCSCHRNWPTSSSMEYHKTVHAIEIGALQVLWKSMEFHETARVVEIGALRVPWNSMIFYLFNGTIGITNTLSFKFGYNSVEFEYPNFDENYIHFSLMN